MRISYNKLFKLLIDKNMKKKELREKAGISASTIVKMGRNEPVSVELIGKICLALDCSAGDVVEFFPDDPLITLIPHPIDPCSGFPPINAIPIGSIARKILTIPVTIILVK